MNQATYLRYADGFRGIARLYKVDPPLDGFEYVIASASDFFSPETDIFAANEHGEVIGWTELSGSTRDIMDPDQAIRNAGYEVLNPFMPEPIPEAEPVDEFDRLLIKDRRPTEIA